MTNEKLRKTVDFTAINSHQTDIQKLSLLGKNEEDYRKEREDKRKEGGKKRRRNDEELEEEEGGRGKEGKKARRIDWLKEIHLRRAEAGFQIENSLLNSPSIVRKCQIEPRNKSSRKKPRNEYSSGGDHIQ